MGFKEDFYWTGGGFSDWSGRSAGKFGTSSGGSSGGGHGSYMSVEKTLQEERKLGYPNSMVGNTQTGPSFTRHLWVRWLGVGAALALLLLSVSIYLNKLNDTEGLIGAGVCYLLGAIGMFMVMIFLEETYPDYIHPTITEKHYRRFYNHQRVMIWFCFVTTVVFSLTPFICWPLEDFINAEMNHEGILSFLHWGEYYGWYHDKSYDVDWLLGAFVAFFSIIPFLMMLSCMPICTEKEYRKRLRYILNKAGVYDETKRNNIARIVEIDKMIQQKMDEIRQLRKEKARLENIINKV